MYKYIIADSIQEYINEELNDSIYYFELSKFAPNENSREILLNIGRDEKSHAENFKQAYYYLTGRVYLLKQIKVPEISGYEEGLKNRLLAETENYKKYSKDYIEAQNKYLKNLFFMIRTSEAQHAMRIPVLLQN